MVLHHRRRQPSRMNSYVTTPPDVEDGVVIAATLDNRPCLDSGIDERVHHVQK